MHSTNKRTGKVIALCVAACVAALVALPSSAVADKFDKGLLWSVSKDGVTVAHVFGTLHSNNENVIKMAQSPTIDGLIHSAKNFGMEAFPKTRYFNPHWGYKSVLADMMLPEGQTLEQLAGTDLYEKVRTLLIKNGVPADRIERLKPWAAMHSLTARRTKSKSGGEIQDTWLFEHAADIVSNLYQVETLEELIASYYSFPQDAQVALLADRANFFDKIAGHNDKVTKAYMQENLKDMLANNLAFISAKSEKKGYKDIYLKHVLHDRNIVMAHYMLAPMRNGRTFFALGALHLQGDKGVLGILEKTYGFRVERVMIK